MQAAELIAELKRTAHVVAVMEQDVLMQAFGDAQVGRHACPPTHLHCACSVCSAERAGSLQRGMLSSCSWPCTALCSVQQLRGKLRTPGVLPGCCR